MKKYSFAIAALCIILMLLLGACGPKEQEILQNLDSISAQVEMIETVYLGAVFPLTGTDSARAPKIQAALELAVDIINNQHDIPWDLARAEGLLNYGNAHVEVIFSDCQSNVLTASYAAEELLDMGVVGLLGAYSIDYTPPVASRAYVHHIPMVCGSARSPRLTDGETYGFAQFFNRISPTSEQESQLFFEMIHHVNQTQNAGIEKLALVYPDSAYGQQVLESFDENAAAGNYQVVARIAYPAGQENLAVEVSRAIANEPDVIFQAVGNEEELLRFAQTYVASLYEPSFLLTYGSHYFQPSLLRELEEQDVDYFAGIRFFDPMSVYVPEDSGIIGITPEEEPQDTEDKLDNEILEYINNLYFAKTGENMDNDALMEFASVIVFAQAVNAIGTTEPEALAAALKELTFDAPYLYGRSIDFDENGQNILPPGYIARIVDGKFALFY